MVNELAHFPTRWDNVYFANNEQASIAVFAAVFSGRFLRFLLICEIMLKIIATAKQENKAIYNTYYIVPDLIDFFCDDWKEIKTQSEKRSIHNCKKYCTD